MKAIDLEICKICGCSKDDDHHAYEAEVLLAPDNCVCFDDEEWADKYTEEGIRYIPEVCDHFEYDGDGLACINCYHNLECHRRT